MKALLKAFALLVLIVVVLGFVGVFRIVSRGISARGQPGRVETVVARTLRHLAIPRSARELKNPVARTPEVIAEGMAHFADHCAGCHANNGSGDTEVGRGLYPKPPDMTAAATQQLTDGELYYIIENGVRFTGMPAFGEDAGSDRNTESWDLVHFIRRLPSITDDEVTAMKKMNPKSPMELEREERMRKFLQGDDNPPAESSHEHHH